MSHNPPIDHLAVVGAGTMGAGIAQLAAVHGCRVTLIDVNREALERGRASIGTQLDRMVDKGKLTAAECAAVRSRIATRDEIADLTDASLAIEAVVEDLAVKHKVFAALEQAVGVQAVLATNTSSLSVGRIAEGVRRSARVVGMHFFNPAPVMPLVEIIAGRHSDPSCVDRAFEAARAWGKTPVRVKDTPGFIVNRVARGYYLEALRLLGEGVAGVDEIDGMMRHLGGFRMGPFELMDLVGLDVNLAVSTSVWEQMGRPPRLAPHEIQVQLVAAGHLGRKTGRGFYAYDGDGPLPACPVQRKSFSVSPLQADVMRAFTFAAGAASASTTEQLVFCRILAAVINEAGLALGESVATAEDIDTAMLKGTNYPKGPLAWAQQIGPRTVRGALKALDDAASGGRYEPASIWTSERE